MHRLQDSPVDFLSPLCWHKNGHVPPLALTEHPAASPTEQRDSETDLIDIL